MAMKDLVHNAHLLPGIIGAIIDLFKKKKNTEDKPKLQAATKYYASTGNPQSVR